MKGRNDRGSSSRAVLVGVARVRHEGGFKKNEITDWVAANWPASNQSLAGWMREYIMYILSPSLPLRLISVESWNRCIPHSKSYFPVCTEKERERGGRGREIGVETIIENELCLGSSAEQFRRVH